MKTGKAVAFAAIIMGLTAASYAADLKFDTGTAGEKSVLGLVSDFNADIPAPGKPEPGDRHPGPDGHHPGPDGHHPGQVDHHKPDPCPTVIEPDPFDYVREGIKQDCRVWKFSEGTSNTRTEKFNMREYGTSYNYRVEPRYDHRGCVAYYHREFLSTSPYERDWGHSRELTVEIGQRQLQPGETEELTICQTGEVNAEITDLSKMAYEYGVRKENASNFFKKATRFTLTPGQHKD